MAWVQLTFETTDAQTPVISEALSELGALAVTLEDAADQPLYEPPPGETPLWSSARVTGLFDATLNTEEFILQLTKKLDPDPLPPWRSSPLEDKDWEREWMDNYHPIAFGKRLWIVPSWHEPPQPDAVNILLDPGLAFGTGTHPTTALCLEWLDQHLQPEMTVIDYGCGSGILAVAATLLGAREVIAVDNDPQALLATRQNAEKNNVQDHIQVFAPGAHGNQPVDVLVANILALPLIELAERFASLVKTGGKIVMSGILQHQAEQVSAACQPWFEMQPPVQKEDWIRLEGQRKQ